MSDKYARDINLVTAAKLVVTEPMAKKGIRAGHQNRVVDVAMVECAHVFGMIVDRAKPELLRLQRLSGTRSTRSLHQ